MMAGISAKTELLYHISQPLRSRAPAETMASFIDNWRESKVRKIAVVTWFALWCLLLECAVTGLIIYGTIQAAADDTSLFCWHPYLFSGGFCIVLSSSTP